VLGINLTFSFTLIISLNHLLWKENTENACNSTDPPHRCGREVADRARRGNYCMTACAVESVIPARILRPKRKHKTKHSLLLCENFIIMEITYIRLQCAPPCANETSSSAKLYATVGTIQNAGRKERTWNLRVLRYGCASVRSCCQLVMSMHPSRLQP
jgi:hypothetical protein